MISDGEAQFERLLREGLPGQGTRGVATGDDVRGASVIVEGGEEEYHRQEVAAATRDANGNACEKRSAPPKYRHPLRAPMTILPSSKESGEEVPICRYHNYHDEGCRKGAECPFDHTVCH